MKIYVLYKDALKKEISAVFYSPQDETIYPGIEEIDDDDKRFTAFVSSSKNPFIN
ncbi:TPA: hypothetical protein ACNVZV_003428 [Escherichia coli]|nr:hypothetical protein [Escherichia coli]EHN2281565.1 hypothetical protein [Shigella sonnei]EHP8055586.1 hypothetical protein [Escherichia coli]EHV6037536.1 hypothetical protein [Escherichia coli]EIM5965355.1 hypothetical protein [Escherichia coli]